MRTDGPLRAGIGTAIAGRRTPGRRRSRTSPDASTAPVFPGDTMELRGVVSNVAADDTGCGWVELDVTLSADGRIATTCAARIAVPATPDDNPWSRRGDAWRP